ncbi:MAG TPA: N-acetyltransferase, partial [Gammaproteobacteria bacterium]|nr:N-acetyltransferase [Gammaproteobacteria bacterium]
MPPSPLVRIADGEDMIRACYPVMRELRPDIAEDEFVSRVHAQQAQGYRLAMLEDAGEVVAVAGFRISENLAWGRFLYVDDMVTLAAQRSRGFGGALLAWLRAHAREQGCAQLHLDSGF